MPVSVAEKVGVWPATTLSKASFNVTVTVDVAAPLATTGPVPLMVEKVAATLPATKLTVPSALMIGVAIERVLSSALVEARVQVETPEALVAEQDP